ESVQSRPVNLVKNEPPQVKDIQILDRRGFSLGSALTEVTEGRNILVHVVASDREIGGDSVKLYQAPRPDPSTAAEQLVGEDLTAPFEFPVSVPTNHRNEMLSFRAVAKDLDGYSSGNSAPRNVKIVADQPPSAEIILPANNESAIIDGQSIAVQVKAT